MTDSAGQTRWWRAIGPALIVAAVVLGPGSLVTASRVGCEHGAALLWVLVLATAVMTGAVVVAASVGRTLERTPGEELAAALGRGASAAVGVTLFLVVVSFQGSNNAAVLAGLEPLGLGAVGLAGEAAALLAINAAVAAVFWLGRDLYRPIERLMKLLVGLMAAAFVLNVALAQPSLAEAARGLVPSIPDGATLLPRWVVDGDGAGRRVDPLASVTAMIATTFSIAAAYYQSYLVREKRRLGDPTAGSRVDAVLGIAALGLATALVMLTSAAVLHGRVPPSELTSVQAVADQLRPLFGAAASWVFAVGILAGAFSSFLVNALIGGTLLADGFGWPSGMNDRAQKIGTTVALLLGAAVAIVAKGQGNQIEAIVLMQKLTLLGGPLLAAALLYLGHRAGAPKWAMALAALGAALVVVVAGREAYLLTL